MAIEILENSFDHFVKKHYKKLIQKFNVSNEELKTLSSEEIDRHYQDLSKGSIPPRGATPLMAVFSNLPKGMDELEVEVVR